MTAAKAPVEGGETSALVPHISMCMISSTVPLLVKCVRVYARVCVSAADCCAHTHSVTLLWFPREETRFLLHCNIWFITIWNSTSVRLLCLKKSSQRPKEQGGKNPPKRHCLEIDSCYCAVPSGAFAREQKRVNILWCVVAVAQPLLHSQSEIPGARSLCTQWRETLNISMAPYQPMWLI